MSEFLSGMSTLEQTYWIIALLGSAIFVIIFIMTFIGGDVDVEADADFDPVEVGADDGGVGYQFFTFKNVVAFFTIFGWTGVICVDAAMSTGITILLSTIAGLIMMVLTTLLFFWMHRLAESGTLVIKNAIGVIAEVYLPIGASRSRMGKVTIKVQGSLRELDALTDSEHDLHTMSLVKVVEIIGEETLLVEPVTK